MVENKFFKLCKSIQKIHRSLTGKGNLKTLTKFKKINSSLKIIKFKSKQKVFDWQVPYEWNIKSAWIKDLSLNKRVLDFDKNMLSVVGYSMPVNKVISLKELKKRIFALKSQPNSTPYVNTYYEKNWGFCMPYNQKKKLKDNKYHVYINSYFKKGNLHCGEIFIPGRLKQEILLSTYICHPYMANNELSGPSILIFLSNWIKKKKRKFSYRILFTSETIGAISYINKNLEKLKKNVIAGYVITCVGDERMYSYLQSKEKNTLSDKIAIETLKKNVSKYKIYTWIKRGSDERQFNSPGVMLGVGSIMRSKYDTYKEYHTSEDDLYKVVTPKGLKQSFELMKKIINNFESSIIPRSKIICEPFLSKRKLYFKPSIKNTFLADRRLLWDFLSYCDGNYLLKEIAKYLNISLNKAKKIAYFCKKKNLIEF